MNSERKGPAIPEHRQGLENDSKQSNNDRRTRDENAVDCRIVALVKLLARLAADEDFRDGHD